MRSQMALAVSLFLPALNLNFVHFAMGMAGCAEAAAEDWAPP